MRPRAEIIARNIMFADIAISAVIFLLFEPSSYEDPAFRYKAIIQAYTMIVGGTIMAVCAAVIAKVRGWSVLFGLAGVWVFALRDRNAEQADEDIPQDC